MRITIVQGAFLPVPPLCGGNIEKKWFALGKEFAKRGHTVLHISRMYDNLPMWEELDGVRHLRILGYDAPRSVYAYRFLDLLYAWRARRVLPVADILVTNSIWLPILVRSRKYGALYVHVARMPKGQMRLYSHAARLQAVSSAAALAIQKELPSSQKVKVIPNPLPPQFQKIGIETSLARNRSILYVGRIHPEKGLEILLKAFQQLVNDGLKDWRLIIVGPYEASLGGGGEVYYARLRAISESIGTQVQWVGFVCDQNALRAYYQQAMIFVYPSLAERGETFGGAPLEAMACGCPPVVSNLDCFKDFVQDGINGLIFDHRVADPVSALTAKLRQLITSKTEWAKLSENGMRVTETHSLERITELFLEDFQSLLECKHVTHMSPPATMPVTPPAKTTLRITVAQGAFLPIPPIAGGGVEKVWFDLAKEFARNGHAVTHIARTYPSLPNAETADGVHYMRIRGFDAPKSKILYRLCDLIYSLRVLRHLPPADILITHCIWLPIFIRSRKRGALYVHVSRFPKGQMWLYKHAARLETVSKTVAVAIAKEAPQCANRIKIIYPHLPNHLIAQAATFVKDSAGRKNSILYVGRIHPEKGLDLLIEAFQQAAAHAPNWRLVFVGPWEAQAGGGGESYFQKLRQQAAPLGDRVEWLGSVYDPQALMDHYLSARVFVYPSVAEKGESFGLAPLEAMACGCAVVVSALDCFKDYLNNGINGLIFDHRSVSPATALAEKLRFLIDAPEKCEEISRAARKTAQEFNLEQCAKLFIADFETILRER